MISQGKGLIEGSGQSLSWRKTLKLVGAVMLLLGKERQVTTFKQNTEVLAFLSGTALGHALGWLKRWVILSLEPHIHLFISPWPFYPSFL